MQCGSCPSVYWPGSLYHARLCYNRHRPYFFCAGRARYEAFLNASVQMDNRLVAPEKFFNTFFGPLGYAKLLDVLLTGDYNAEIKKSFVHYTRIHECNVGSPRFYILGSVKLGLLYIGSCLYKLLDRLKKHIAAALFASRILVSDDVQISVIGYCSGGKSFKDIKESLELCIAKSFEGCAGKRFVNVRR